MTFAMVPEAVALSASTEGGLAAETGGAAAGVAPALLNPVPMGMDADSAKFAAMLRRGCGPCGCRRTARPDARLVSGAQSLAMTTTVATEVMRAAATAI